MEIGSQTCFTSGVFLQENLESTLNARELVGISVKDQINLLTSEKDPIGSHDKHGGGRGGGEER